MMQSPAQSPSLVVFNFRLAKGHPEIRHVAPYKATLEHIQALGAEPLPGTEQDVAAEDLDAKGRYRRVATGWGELA